VGYPIEMYIQDASEKAPEGQGVYSLKRDVWAISPSNLHLNLEDDPILQKSVDNFADMIEDALNKKNYKEIILLKNKLKEMRT
jgi:hypothetical protein